ncbi:Alpha-1 3-mannosyl-glycoprotein 4-beta-N-acetylglucosaminyltransferase A [Trichostrongylus colubriformis]|uniref:Alpha-1 3-mannosyl-glycoprotein 4-beta-N-acetylglucosaminyltransferase A n=1 Tax=Trichostrongylus colubriformis TaxID=6319 RepID=A0AAN8F7T6_TRICO
MRPRQIVKLVLLLLGVALVNIALLMDALFFSEKFKSSREMFETFVKINAEKKGWLERAAFKQQVPPSIQHGNEIRKEMEAKASDANIFEPGLLSLLPHLVSVDTSSLEPLLFTNRNRTRRKIAFGIPVVGRKTSYVLQTLHSLFENLEEQFKPDVVFIVVFAYANVTVESFSDLIELMKTNFTAEIQTGLLEIAAIPNTWYSLDLNAIQPTFNDSAERMRWRTKQNLDYIYIMNYGRKRAEYYMHLEDDITATARYG